MPATRRFFEEPEVVAWAHGAEVTLRAWHLAAQGVDGRGVFFHKPSTPKSTDDQKQILIKAGVYHALAICWEPSVYAAEQGVRAGEAWWVPREWFKRTSPLAASIADKDCISIPGYSRAREYSEGW